MKRNQFSIFVRSAEFTALLSTLDDSGLQSRLREIYGRYESVDYATITVADPAILVLLDVMGITEQSPEYKAVFVALCVYDEYRK